MTTSATVPGLREDVDRAERAGRVRHLDGQRRAHRLVDAGLHERARAVQRAAHHRRRVGQVGRDLVARDRHVRRDRHVADVDAVRAEVVGERGGAVGPGRDLLPDEPLGVVDQRVHQLGERLRAVPLGERDERALGDRAGGDLRAEVAERHPRDADVRLDDLEDVLDRLALGVEACSQGRRMPSWKISVLSQALEPGSRPPTSPWCAVVHVKPISSPPRWTGLKTKMSCRCMPPSKGSFITKTSPGRIRSP